MDLKPDPRIEIENQHDREVNEIEQRERLQREEEERVIRIAGQQMKKEERAKKKELKL